MKKFLTVAALSSMTALAAMSFAGSASAEGGIKVGMLSCDIAGGYGYIIGSSKDVSCIFNPAGSARPNERYVGSMTRVGADIGVTTAGKMVWAVFAPGRVDVGALQGTYVGATGQATVGVGIGANVLVGGLENGFTLQPVSFEGQTGFNVAGGIGGLRLNAVN